jgi:EmrB/QacA subfamily drug resistance transporter
MLSDKKVIPFIVSLAMFMEALDTTIINTAIPSMAHSLQVNPIDLKVALISYLLSLAIFIPISGWIADKYGVKRVFIAALIIFTLSSFWCGFAHTLNELVLARITQGLGGSMMLPIGRLIIIRTFLRHELIIAMSRVVIIGALGLMLGPVLGGIITHYLSWRWIFWINIPVGILNILCAKFYLLESEQKTVPPLDKLGFILFGGGLALLTFGLSAVTESTIKIFTSCTIIFSSICMLLAYAIHSRKVSHPIVKTSLLKIRTFRIAILGNLFSRLGFGGVPFLLPLLLQIGLGYSAQLSGLLLAPIAAGVLLVKPLSMHFLRYLGYKNLLIINTVFVGFALWLFMSINAATPVYLIALYTFIFGILISLQYSGMNSLCYADIDQENFSAATSIMSTVQQLSQSFGVAVSAIGIQFFMNYFSEASEITVNILRHVFMVMGVITLLSIAIFIRLKSGDGQAMISNSQPSPVEIKQ